MGLADRPGGRRKRGKESRQDTDRDMPKKKGPMYKEAMKIQDDSALEDKKFNKNRSNVSDPNSENNSLFDSSNPSNIANPTEVVTDRPPLSPYERIIQVPIEKIIEVPVERIVERIIEVPVERIVEVERYVEVPVERIVEVERVVEKEKR